MRSSGFSGLQILFLVFVVLGLTVAGCLDPRAGSTSPSPTTSGQDLVVRRGDLAEIVLLTGEIEAERAEVLAAPNVNIWPLTVRYLAEDGASVGQGDVVGEFDNSQLLSKIEDTRTQAIEAANRLTSERSRVASEVAEATIELERRRAAVDKAELDASVPAELLSEREYARAQLGLRRARLGFDAAELTLASVREAGEADIRIQQIALDRARDAALRAETFLDRLSLRAPRDGIVVRGTNMREGRPVRSGDTVWPGLVVARLPDLDSLYVKARLFDVDDGRLVAGQDARVTLDAYPEVEIDASVRGVAAMATGADPFSDRRFFEVAVDLLEIDPERMRPGMSAQVAVEGRRVEDVLLVPREALDFSAERVRAALVSGGSVEVEIGACTPRLCILVEGLEEGSRLRFAGPRYESP